MFPAAAAMRLDQTTTLRRALRSSAQLRIATDHSRVQRLWQIAEYPALVPRRVPTTRTTSATSHSARTVGGSRGAKMTQWGPATSRSNQRAHGWNDHGCTVAVEEFRAAS